MKKSNMDSRGVLRAFFSEKKFATKAAIAIRYVTLLFWARDDKQNRRTKKRHLKALVSRYLAGVKSDKRTLRLHWNFLVTDAAHTEWKGSPSLSSFASTVLVERLAGDFEKNAVAKTPNALAEETVVIFSWETVAIADPSLKPTAKMIFLKTALSKNAFVKRLNSGFAITRKVNNCFTWTQKWVSFYLKRKKEG